VVASRLLGRRAGLVSGSALVVDYVLTISISIAAGAEAIFSFLPHEWAGARVLGLVPLKLGVEFVVISLLIIMNLRGVKESVTILTPVFLTFLATHAILIAGVIIGRAHEVPAVAAGVRDGWSHALQAAPVGIGMIGVAALLLRAYSMGAGTYTGIEAVSNGLTIMREPKVETGKRTMALMATSLALTAGGLLIAYLLANVTPTVGKTMNAVLAETFAARFSIEGFPVGAIFVFVTLASEALLLFVAAQAGFIDGPRVMANMAVDSYLPHRFSQLSDRLTMENGTLLMGGASLLALLYTGGDVSKLVVMYSINVFVTFSLSQLAMVTYWIRERRKHIQWPKHLSIHGLGLLVCVFILSVTVYEKFGEGGWLTLVLTGVLVAFCELIRRHYAKVGANLRTLDDVLGALPADPGGGAVPLDPKAPTAVVLVGSYAGLGIHTLLSIHQLFPGYYKNFVFASVGVIDSASFTNVEAVDDVRRKTEEDLRRYVELARRLGLASDYRIAMGTEAVADGEELCRTIAREFRNTIFFAGKLVFEEERWYQRILHNETAYQLQRKLQFAGLHAMVLPVRVLAKPRAA
jgi:amino acid transporter